MNLAWIDAYMTKRGMKGTTFLSFTESNEQVGVETMGSDAEFEAANFCRRTSKSLRPVFFGLKFGGDEDIFLRTFLNKRCSSDERIWFINKENPLNN